MLAKNMMGHPQDQHHLEKMTERGKRREKRVSRESRRKKGGEKSRECVREVL